MRVAPSLHRLGEAIVSCYLLEEAGEVTVIDAGVPAYYDAPLARGQVENPSAGMGERKLRSLLHYMLWLTRHGGMRTTALTEVGTFEPGTTLDVPGALRVIHTPGHTHGSVTFHAPGTMPSSSATRWPRTR